MFRPVEMIQVDILLLQKDLDRASLALARSGLLHLRRAEGRQLFSFDAWEAERVASRSAYLQGQEERLCSIATELGATSGAGTYGGAEALEPWDHWGPKLRRRLQRLQQRRHELRDWQQGLQQIESLLAPLEELAGTCAGVQGARFFSLLTGALEEKDLPRLQHHHPHLRIFPLGRRHSRIWIAILTPRHAVDRVLGALESLPWQPLTLPPALRRSFSQEADRVRTLKARVRQLLILIEARLEGLRAEWQRPLQDALATLRAERRLLAAREGFGYTERLVALSGWLPRNQIRHLRQVMKTVCRGEAVLHCHAVQGGDIPVQLDNPRLIRPFQNLLQILGTPSYQELEPTPLLAAGFLLLFGMMFGDLGHGLVFLIAGLLLRKATRFKDEGTILAEVGVSASLFGVLFGSVFGWEDLLAPLWFSPAHQIAPLMAASLALGVGLILTGLGLRIINRLMMGWTLELLTDRLGLAGLLFYSGAVALSLGLYAGNFPPEILLWLLLPLGAIFCHPFMAQKKGPDRDGFSLAVEGIIEVLETVLGFVANTFSFLRVAAFGLAHVGLSLAVFAVADQVSGGPFGIVGVALVHLFGNLVILLLEGLVVSVQAVRLQFYEFFGKFFTGSGVPFRPLTLEPGGTGQR